MGVEIEHEPIPPVTDHGALTGLADDDHPQYTTAAEAAVIAGAAVTTHEGDPADAHDASAISILDAAAQYAATDVEAALAEVLDALQAHEADATDAHDASAISNVPAGTVAATNVQAAIDELATDYAAADAAHEGAADPHTGYLKEADANYVDLTDGGATTLHSHAGEVTNGNSHDHAGGDGAQIDHGGLAGLTDNDHTQYVRNIHEEVAAALTNSQDLHFMGAGVAAVYNGGSSRIEVIIPTVYDAVVDSGETNAAGKGNVYSTLQAAITAGHATIVLREAADVTAITITSGNGVVRIVGDATLSSVVPVNIQCNKDDVSFDYLQFNGTKLILVGVRDIAFACLFTGNLPSGTALINNGAGITASATSIAFDNGANSGLPATGCAKIDNEVFFYSGGGSASSGTLTLTAAATRGALDTLAESHADNATITNLKDGHLVLVGADQQATACRFVGCTNANQQCLYIASAAARAKVNVCTFLSNTTWSCIVIAPENGGSNAPVGVQLVGNTLNGNTCFDFQIAIWNAEDSDTTRDVNGLGMQGNFIRQFDAGALRMFCTRANIAGNIFDGVSRSTLAHQINQVGGITNSATTIPYDTASGVGTMAEKGIVLIDSEWIAYSAKTATNLLGCKRGFNGTTAATHADNAAIAHLSQRVFQQVPGGSSMSALFNIVSGNTIGQVRVITFEQTTTSGGTAANNCKLVFSNNPLVNVSTFYGGTGTAFLDNATGALTYDFDSKSGQVIWGGGSSGALTVANVPSDAVILWSASNNLVGTASKFQLPSGIHFGFGRAAGDTTDLAVPLTNKTGVNSVATQVVVIDTATDNAFSTTTTGGLARRAGVCVQGSVADGSPALVAVAGVVSVLCNGTVNRGDRLETSGTAGEARATGAASVADFAIALTARSGAGSSTVKALLL